MFFMLEVELGLLTNFTNFVFFDVESRQRPHQNMAPNVMATSEIHLSGSIELLFGYVSTPQPADARMPA